MVRPGPGGGGSPKQSPKPRRHFVPKRYIVFAVCCRQTIDYPDGRYTVSICKIMFRFDGLGFHIFHRARAPPLKRFSGSGLLSCPGYIDWTKRDYRPLTMVHPPYPPRPSGDRFMVHLFPFRFHINSPHPQSMKKRRNASDLLTCHSHPVKNWPARVALDFRRSFDFLTDKFIRKTSRKRASISIYFP